MNRRRELDKTKKKLTALIFQQFLQENPGEEKQLCEEEAQS